MSSPPIIEFRYGGNRNQLLFLLIVTSFGWGLLIFFALRPLGDDATLKARFNHYVIVTAASFSWIGWVSLCIHFISTFTHKMRVAVTSFSIIRPKSTLIGISKEETEIPFESILDVRVEPLIGNAKAIQIYHDGTKTAIPSNMLPNRQDFENLYDHLVDAIFAYRELQDDDEDF
jgi:hypothetical protein